MIRFSRSGMKLGSAVFRADGFASFRTSAKGWRFAHNSVLSSLEVIRKLNPKLNAVVHTISDEEAAVSISESPEASGVLDGIPVLVKDSVDVKGMPTVVGMEARVGSIADEDAEVVSRIKASGAVILGKTNVPQGCLDMQTFNKVFGVTVNPYDVERTCGGSSGGSCVAVASGMVPLAVGSDLGGSLRMPASFCGVFAFKPTARRVPPLGHVPRIYCLQNNLTIGAVANSVAMLENFMIAACHGPGMMGMPAKSFDTLEAPQPRDVRVILSTSLPDTPTEIAVVDAMETFAQKLEQSGVEVVRGFPSLDTKALFRAHKLQAELCTHVSAPGANPLARPQPDKSPTSAQLASAEQVREKARMEIEAALGPKRFSVWVLPTCGVLPFKHNLDHEPILVNGKEYPYWQPLLGYCFQAAACGNPTATVPIGMVGQLPVGAQIVGRLWEDEELMAVSRLFESLLSGAVEKPPIYGRS